MNAAALASAAFCVAWVVLLTRRAPDGGGSSAGRAIVGGTVAFAAASAAYLALERNGMRITWAELTAGGGGSVVLAAAIGLVEESAKLLGLAVASLGPRPLRGGVVLPRILGVSAVFASLECAFTLGGAGTGVILARAAFAPVAHAALSLPLGLVFVDGGRGVRWALPALTAAAVLHGASNLALATPSIGRLGYAVVLAAPAIALHLRTRLIWAREARAA